MRPLSPRESALIAFTVMFAAAFAFYRWEWLRDLEGTQAPSPDAPTLDAQRSSVVALETECQGLRRRADHLSNKRGADEPRFVAGGEESALARDVAALATTNGLSVRASEFLVGEGARTALKATAPGAPAPKQLGERAALRFEADGSYAAAESFAVALARLDRGLIVRSIELVRLPAAEATNGRTIRLKALLSL